MYTTKHPYFIYLSFRVTEQREAKKSNREEKEKFEKIFSNFEKRKRKGFHFSRFERRKRNFLNDSPLSRRERERDFIFSRFERRTRNSKYKFCKYEINFRTLFRLPWKDVRWRPRPVVLPEVHAICFLQVLHLPDPSGSFSKYSQSKLLLDFSMPSFLYFESTSLQRF